MEGWMDGWMGLTGDQPLHCGYLFAPATRQTDTNPIREPNKNHRLFAWLISHQPAVLFSHNKSATSHQPAVLFSHNKSATSNQPAVLFSHNKSAPAISHQPTEQAVSLATIPPSFQLSPPHHIN
jgi:hypothetical protein